MICFLRLTAHVLLCAQSEERSSLGILRPPFSTLARLTRYDRLFTCLSCPCVSPLCPDFDTVDRPRLTDKLEFSGVEFLRETQISPPGAVECCTKIKRKVLRSGCKQRETGRGEGGPGEEERKKTRERASESELGETYFLFRINRPTAREPP